jgi:hypothetical protein
MQRKQSVTCPVCGTAFNRVEGFQQCLQCHVLTSHCCVCATVLWSYSFFRQKYVGNVDVRAALQSRIQTAMPSIGLHVNDQVMWEVRRGLAFEGKVPCQDWAKVLCTRCVSDLSTDGRGAWHEQILTQVALHNRMAERFLSNTPRLTHLLPIFDMTTNQALLTWTWDGDGGHFSGTIASEQRMSLEGLCQTLRSRMVQPTPKQLLSGHDCAVSQAWAVLQSGALLIANPAYGPNTFGGYQFVVLKVANHEFLLADTQFKSLRLLRK